MSGLFDGPAPRWFNIPAHRPFVEDLARGLVAELAPLGPDALSHALVLTPTRRGARSLAEAFIAAADGRAILPPQIRPLGDLDEGEPPFEPGDLALSLAPAISAMRRRFELARLVVDHQDLLDRKLDAAQALDMGDALGALFDAIQIEERDPSGDLADLAPADLAEHWRASRVFLETALAAWPERLAGLGVMDVSARRVALLRRLAEAWTAQTPEGVLIAAGSTGTAPATADLLAVIASAPMGAVVLPGLDQSLAETAWAEVGEQHPQGALKRLLHRAGVERGAVAVWPASLPYEAGGRWRRRLINEALRPADATADWRHVIEELRREGGGVDPIAAGLEGLTLAPARDEEEAASLAALLLRETLETPGRTAALVTPDQALVRRVSAKLARWGVTADSSAGVPLAGCSTAVLAALVAQAAADPLDPVLQLAILKHPLTRLGDEQACETLERRVLRGPRALDWPALERRLAPGLEAAAELLTSYRAVLAPLQAAFEADTAEPGKAAKALASALETLAAGPDGGVGDLWSGPGGAAMASLISDLIHQSGPLPPATLSGFGELLERLIASETIRTGGATHPRLRILGAIEARLVRADRLILAGLEEGVWPQTAPADPFLSRPMRERLGLPPPERRIGLSAHDFAQAASAPEVVLIATERRDNAPAIRSRWLWRLETMAKGAGVALPGPPAALDWARALDAPIDPPPESLKTAARPKPTPPVDLRPRELAVTGVERWVRDPYALYARSILRLRPLDRPAEPVEARARGTAVHAAFERFARGWPELPEDAEALFADLLVEELAAAGIGEARLMRERALAANLAPWAVALERKRRAGAELLIEQEGRLTLEVNGRPFTLTARADRIERRAGAADILDFKTGAPPSAKQMQSGLSPQLTLTAAIVRGGGFAEAGALDPGELVYVRVSGGRTPGEELVRAAGDESLTLALAALEGLKRRIARFDEPETPYISWAAPQFIHQFEGDYDHLARLWEWHVIGEGEAGEGSP